MATPRIRTLTFFAAIVLVTPQPPFAADLRPRFSVVASQREPLARAVEDAPRSDAGDRRRTGSDVEQALARLEAGVPGWTNLDESR
jgi:hypothetical protein